MLFAVCSDRGAPGCTTAALALAAARGLPSVVVEADPYGGDLALRCRVDGDPLPPTPTVLGLGTGLAAAPLRPTADAAEGGARRLDLWREGSHGITELVRVVPGFATAEQGSSLAWEVVAATVASQRVPVFADLGRIHSGSPSLPIATAADAVLVVCRGEVSSVQHLLWRLEQLVPMLAERTGRPPVVVPVVVTSRRDGSRVAGQVAGLLAESAVGPTVRGVGALAWDPGAVALLAEGVDPWAKPLRGSALVASARKVTWLLGRVTGVEHADPYAARARGTRGAGRTRRGQQPRSAVRAPVGTAAATSVAGSGSGSGSGSGPSFEGLRRLRRPAGVREGE